MRRYGARTRVVGLLLAGVAVVGCGQGKGPLVPEASRPVQHRVALEAFEDCGALERFIEDTAVSQMKADLVALREGSGWGWSRWGGGGGLDLEAGAPVPVSGGVASPGPSDYTTTNTQVEGVDEADFVKNDGTRIFALVGRTLHVTRSWPADQLALTASVQLEGWPREMFLAENDRLVVFSSVYTPEWDLTEAQATGGMPADGWWWAYGAANTTKVTTLDVADVHAPRVVGETYLAGDYVSARRVGSAVRLVLRDAFRYPRDVRMWPEMPAGGFQTEAQWKAAVDALVAPNEKAIRARTLEAWLPPGKRRLDGRTVELPSACTDVHVSNAPTRLGLATVATLDVDDPTAEVRRTTVVGEVGEVYASHDALYLASKHWWWWPEPGQTDATYLHKFDLRQPDRAVYVASGMVDGHIKDPFSLDEHQGFLRVVTTEARRVPDAQNPENRWGVLETATRVSVLGEDAGQLVVRGRTGELAKGEQVFGVRLLGARGFVVTYRQVDPLFSLDLSDPAHPRVVGELKIPGFSTYLHPVDEHHLLAIGEDRDEQGSWTSRRLKLSLYDVSDLAAPKEKFKQVLGDSDSASEASWNHKAFNYFPAKKMVAVPFTDWSSRYQNGMYVGRSISELRLFHVDTAAGFTARGALGLGDLYQSSQGQGWSYAWQPYVRRSVMADDFVYAIADAGIRVAPIGRLSEPVKTVTFPRDDLR